MAISAYAAQREKKTNRTRLCAAPSGVATPQNVVADSTIAQIGHRKAIETFSSAYHLVLTAVCTSVTAFAVLAIEPAVRSMSVSSL